MRIGHRYLPSVENIYTELLRSRLYSSNLLIGDRLAKVVVGNVSEATLANEVGVLWRGLVDMFFELHLIVSELWGNGRYEINLPRPTMV